MTELPLLAQPYPDNRPWVDLREFMEPSWTMDSAAWHFRGLIDGNTCYLHLRTRRGTNYTIAENLPEVFRPAGQLMLPAFAPGVSYSIGAVLETNGLLRAYSPGNPVADGTLGNLVMQVSYARKAV